MLKSYSLEDIQVFLDIKYRMFCQAVSKYMIVLICVMLCRHLPPFERLPYEHFNGGFRFKGGGGGILAGIF
jgi:hypothetical protein